MGAIIELSECLLVALNFEKVSASQEFDLTQLLGNLGDQVALPIRFYPFACLDASHLDLLMSELCEFATTTGRTRLLLAGTYLESHITFLTLRALAEGFDVYLLSDLILAEDELHVRTFLMRLFQAGAVPTTLGQLLNEWCLSTIDQVQQDFLEKILATYNNGRLRTPRASAAGLS